ncbi:MAG: hypothetical protein MI922_13940, partial [Bacteroidales bacterium]|nr:hypothetical protein [Bacteroidales bacterium]
MKTKLHLKTCLLLFLFVPIIIQAQNLIDNHDFEDGGGSFNDWDTLYGKEIGVIQILDDAGDHYAHITKSSTLYQKVTSIQGGKTYKCTMVFKTLKTKQTTGYGYAVETGTTVNVPDMPNAATNAKYFCNDNNGNWVDLEDNLSETDVTKDYTMVLPSNATAVYIFIATKGANAVMDIASVELSKPPVTNISFLVKDKLADAPIENASISITLEGGNAELETDATGQVSADLASGNTYSFSVLADWFKKYDSQVTATGSNQQVIVLLDSIQEVKNVETLISKYGDDATPYPIYGHFWNGGLEYTDQTIGQITSSLDYMVGNYSIPDDSVTVQKFKAKDSDFQVIRYQGGWATSYSKMEDDKFGMMYYRCGTLDASISETANSLVVNAPSDNKGKGLIASEDDNFTTFIRVGDELMKVTSVSSQKTYPITVGVERGFDGTAAVAHNAGVTVTLPVYSNPPIPGGDNSNLQYFSPMWGERKTRILESAKELARNKKNDGIWIDILVGELGAQSIFGEKFTIWDHNEETTLTWTNKIKYTKDALDEIYTRFYAQMGYYPVIYGNNVLFSDRYDESVRGFAMEKTAEHPRG